MGATFTSKEKQSVLAFLRNSGLSITDADRDKYINLIVDELKRALVDKPSSLKIYPSYVKFVDKVTQRDKFAVLQLGQVNMTKAYFDSSGDKLDVYGEMSFPMPGLGKEIGADEFFRVIINNARDVLRKNHKVGISFSHALESNENGDGKLISWARGKVKCSEMEGKFIGEEFKKHLEKEFDEEYEFFIVNNATATLIAGLVESDEKEFEDFIGIIHADGYNISYIEDDGNLTLNSKKKTSGRMVVNTLAGSFDKIRYSPSDAEAVKLLAGVQVGKFSHLVNSMCLPLIIRAALYETAKSKIISQNLADALAEMSDLDLEQIMLFLYKGLKSQSNLTSLIKVADLSDMAKMSIVLDEIIQRAAKLVAIQLTGILKYKDIGHSPIQPVGIVVSGNFYEIVRDFEYRVRCEIAKALGESDPRYLKFLYMPNASLLGAGIAAATNL
ncbi:MAG: hypothetical protein PHS44_06530 [Candidatus Dojkabacteria bacterium]|nr:hypothetical protein [Candidatus Dojkabacteria bacterium]